MVTLVLFVTSESMECFEFILDARFQLIIVMVYLFDCSLKTEKGDIDINWILSFPRVCVVKCLIVNSDI